MALNLIITNNTTFDIDVDDLGITVPASNSVTVDDLDGLNSQSLVNLVKNGTLSIDADSSWVINDVSIKDVASIKFVPRTTAEINSLVAQEGKLAYCSDGDGGSPCMVVYDGFDWRVISLGAVL